MMQIEFKIQGEYGVFEEADYAMHEGELGIAVAQSVLGWYWDAKNEVWFVNGYYRQERPGDDGPPDWVDERRDEWDGVFDPVNSNVALAQVMDWIYGIYCDYDYFITSGYSRSPWGSDCQFACFIVSTGGNYVEGYGEADTIPHAICLAALAAERRGEA